jgi:hypothetical protein
MTLAQWIDPADIANRVDGATGIKQITDKSGTGNDVTAVGTEALLCIFQNQSPGTVFWSNDQKVRPANFFGNAAIGPGPSPTQSDTGALIINSGGSPSPRITFDSSADFDAGTNEDLTIEMWIWFTGSPAPVNEIFWDQRDTSLTPASNAVLYITGSGVFGLFVNGALRLSHGTALPTNQWVHLAATRQSSTWKIFQNGVDSGSTYTNGGAFTSQPITIGSAADGQLPLVNAYIDSVRYTVGTVLYTGSFSPIPPDFYPECDKDVKFYQNKSPGDDTLLPGPSFMMRNGLTNMDGPDLTAMIALDRDYIPSPEGTENDIVFGMWNDTSPEPSPLEGWSITNVFDARLFRCNIGTVGFDLVADPGLSTLQTSPQQSQTVFLASFDGREGDTYYTSQDFGKRPCTFSGNTAIDTTNKKFGVSSMGFDGTGNGIVFPDSSDFDFGNGDFTCEGWYYFNSNAVMDLFARWEGSGNRTFLFVKQTAGFELYITTNGSSTFQVGTTAQFPWLTSPIQQWVHIAICREGTTMRVYVDGTQIGSATTIGTSTIFNSIEPLKLGAHASVNQFDGNMDNVRITKGACLYPGGTGFTPPTEAFVDSFNGANDAVIAVEFDSTNDMVRGYVNGIYAGGMYYPGSVGFSNALTIGGARGGTYRNGRIFESIYFDGVLPIEQRQKVEGYMAHKWNFNTELPASHPYRIKGPSKAQAYDEQVLVANFNTAVSDAVASPPGYTAETGQTFSFLGNANLDIQEFKFNNSSVLLDGTGDYLETADSADYTFDGDLTVECWVYFNTVTTNAAFVSHYDSQSGNNRSWIFGKFGGNLRFYTSTDGSVSTIIEFNQTWSPSTGQWYHCAVTRKNNVIRMFVDGVQLGTDATYGSPEALFNCTDPLRIGAVRGGSGITDYVNGHIGPVRIIKGKGIYKTNFTPPTIPFRIKPSAVVIANMDGVDGPSPIPFYSSDDGRTATFYGQAEFDNGFRKFGHSSLKLDGVTDCIGFPHSAELNVGADDFTMEGWFYWTTTPGATAETWAAKADTALSPNTGYEWIWYHNSNQFTFGYTTDGTVATDVYLQTPFSPVAGQWYHLVCERHKDQIFFHRDGDLLGVHTLTATIFSDVAEFSIGGYQQGTTSQEFTGHIDGFRFVKGRALYSGIYPQETPFDNAVDSSKLIMNFNGADGFGGSPAITTDDTTGYDITFVNNAQYDTAQRRTGTSSLYLPATSDYITLPNDASLDPGTKFGVEFWVRQASIGGGYQGIFDQRSTGNQNSLYIGTQTNWVFYYQGANRIVGGTPVANQWHHVYLDYYGTLFSLYVDGVRIGTYINSTAPVQNGTALGADFTGSGSSMTGWIDGFRMEIGNVLYDVSTFKNGLPTTPPNVPEY